MRGRKILGLLIAVVMVLLQVIVPLAALAGAGEFVKVVSPYSYAEMEKDIGDLLARYPELSADIIGRTKEGRFIYSLHLGTGKKVVQLNGAHHGREWMTSLLLMQMVEAYSSAYHNNQSYQGYNVRALLDKVSINFIPMVNPDGVQIAQYGPTNAQRTYFRNLWGTDLPWGRWKSNGAGIDPNSNYSPGWSLRTGVSKPYAWDYKGSRPEQAEEVTAMVADTKAREYTMVLAYHSAGEIIYWNFFQAGAALNRDKSLAGELSRITGYRLIPPSNDRRGGYKDWFIQNYHKPGFTVEIGKTPGYPVPLSEYTTIWNKNHTTGLWAANSSLRLNLSSKEYRSNYLLFANGISVNTQTPPVSFNGRIYVSVKDLARTLGGQVSQDPVKKETILTAGGIEYRLNPMTGTVKENGVDRSHPSFNIYNTVMTDPSFLSTLLEPNAIQWDKTNKTVNLLIPAAVIEDINKPTGTVKVNGGATATASNGITLSITPIDALPTAGVPEMMVANDPAFTDAIWEPLARNKPWSLPVGDGTKTVYVKFKDGDGNESEPIFSAINLDTKAPSGTVSINNGGTYTRGTKVTLKITASDLPGAQDALPSGVKYMMVSNWSHFSGGTWIPYTGQYNLTIPSVQGNRTVYIKLKDGAGNVSPVFTDFIYLDSMSPAGSLSINNGAAYTTSRTVSLNMKAWEVTPGSGVYQMMVANTSTFNGRSWENYAPRKYWTLTSGAGAKKVYVKYRDRAGNVSKLYAKTITLR